MGQKVMFRFWVLLGFKYPGKFPHYNVMNNNCKSYTLIQYKISQFCTWAYQGYTVLFFSDLHLAVYRWGPEWYCLYRHTNLHTHNNYTEEHDSHRRHLQVCVTAEVTGREQSAVAGIEGKFASNLNISNCCICNYSA